LKGAVGEVIKQQTAGIFSTSSNKYRISEKEPKLAAAFAAGSIVMSS